MGSELKCGFECSICGEHHDVLPLSYSVKAPKAVLGIPGDELEKRVVITPDQCVIDGKDFYLRGRIPVPIIGSDEPFIWGVWAEIGPKDFVRTIEQWKMEGREAMQPFRGWLNTEIPIFGNTINVDVDVWTQRVGRRPHFILTDQDHPLAREQRDGMTLLRAEQIAEQMLHQGILSSGPGAVVADAKDSVV
jgi:hypothetical protein